MRAAITIATVMLSATAAQAQFATKYAVSGQPLKLDFAASINPDCSSIGPPTIRGRPCAGAWPSDGRADHGFSKFPAAQSKKRM
jgi:hypothetical protein